MTPLVGRDAELATVRAAVHTGQPRTVLVTGPSGVGRRRLVQEAVAGTPVVRAVASPVAPVPFGLVQDLVTVADEPDRARQIRAYANAVRRLSQPVVVVDDLHWADADSLAVLVDLARSPAGPVLLGTARDEPRRPLAEALSMITRLPDATVITLAGLSTAAVATIIESIQQAPVPVRVALQVRRRTDGLPYWVEELARSATSIADLARVTLPGMAGAALRCRVEAAGPDAVPLAQAAAVLGEQVDLTLLASVLEQPTSTQLPALRRLVDEWVMVETEPDRFTFRHALTREAVAAPVPETIRREWHRRAYEVRRAQLAGPGVLAWHAAGAGLTGETGEHARRAAEELLEAGSGAEALHLAELALEAGAEPAAPIHALAAQAAYAAGWLDDAETHARAWRELVHESDPDATVDAHCLLASLRWGAGDLAGQQRELQAALDVLQTHATTAGSASHARVHAALARSLMRAELDTEAIVEADRALTAAYAASDLTTWRDALTSKGTAQCHQAALADNHAGQQAGLALLDEAERACEAAGDLLTLGRVLNNSLDYRMAGRPAHEQWAIWERTWRRATRLGLHPSLGKITRHAVDLAYRTGQWERGWQVVNDRLPAETDPVERVVLAAKAALLALEADRIDDAVRLVERSTGEAAGMDQFWAVLYVALIDVAVTARTAPPSLTVRALTRYRNAVPLADHARRRHRATEAALWALDAGVPAAAVAAFLAGTLPGGLPPEATLALAEAAGDDAAAIRAGQPGRGPAALPPAAVRRADTLTRLGRSLLRTRQVSQAREYAEEACELLAAWPGQRLGAAQALRRAATTADPALTPREREVCALVTDGRSNQEIADKLGISVRTVAVHVSRLLAKYGCASRTELAVRQLRTG